MIKCPKDHRFPKVWEELKFCFENDEMITITKNYWRKKKEELLASVITQYYVYIDGFINRIYVECLLCVTHCSRLDIWNLLRKGSFPEGSYE